MNNSNFRVIVNAFMKINDLIDLTDYLDRYITLSVDYYDVCTNDFEEIYLEFSVDKFIAEVDNAVTMCDNDDIYKKEIVKVFTKYAKDLCNKLDSYAMTKNMDIEFSKVDFSSGSPSIEFTEKF